MTTTPHDELVQRLLQLDGFTEPPPPLTEAEVAAVLEELAGLEAQLATTDMATIPEEDIRRLAATCGALARTLIDAIVERDKLRHDLAYLRQIVMNVDVYGTAYVWRNPGGEEQVIETPDLNVFLRRVDNVTDVVNAPQVALAQAKADIVRLGEQLKADIVRLGEQLSAAGRWQKIVSDLDRCPHGRHEGDDCAGWRGPGTYDGGCQGGVSLGNPLLGGGAVIGIDHSATRLIRIPEDRKDRPDPGTWYEQRQSGDELHHYLNGYVPAGVQTEER